MSPLPSSFSAPFISMMVRESTPEDTENAILDGTFALISPVMTLTDGRWVAMTRWMPAALASCARRQMASSPSPGATIIRSASSSTIMMICGSFWGLFSSSISSIFLIFSLYPLRSLTL